MSEFGSVADLDGVSFDSNIETAVESVLAGGENAVWVLFEVLCLALVRTRAKYIASSCHTDNSGVTCGRPSGRTVESQNTSASSIRRRPPPNRSGAPPRY